MPAPDAAHLRRIAERCRSCLSIAIKPETRQQLRFWARDLEDMADALEAGREPDDMADAMEGREASGSGADSPSYDAALIATTLPLVAGAAQNRPHASASWRRFWNRLPRR